MSSMTPRSMVALVLITLATLGAAASPPGREPVLKQIKVPHNYYYREMYLPQATSGPSALAWAPEGYEIAVSMQGSLWRVDVATGGARQITNGPGYDYQPDWSPDGRWIVYASYRDDAVELWLLEAASGRVHPLTANGAVNLEPRWSPDGKRVAFVSTLYKQRFHIHTVDVEQGGAAGRVERLTEDSDSGLPRYYYSVFDHFLSPTWSPDGSEILFVSNRGHIWGTGGFWRMKATPGSPARLVHDEETTWKARPDWAKDGRRIVYSSYLGRQWNQLWLMTAEGGDAFPLTYGDCDATSPRWSPDGRRIAFILNEGGNTALSIQEIPGGRRTRVDVTERRPLGPVATLRVEVVDARSGAAVPARISATTADGRSWAPDDAWRHADDFFDRAERKIEYGYFHTGGNATLTVPAGKVMVEVTKGLEYRVAREEITLVEGASETVRVRLERLDDLPARGWWSGDVHVHMNYGGAYRNTPPNLVFQAKAEDLHVVESLIVNKEQRVPDIASFDGGRTDPSSTSDTLLVHSQEYHTSYWGHTGLLGLTRNILLPGYAGYVNTPAASLYPHNAAVADLAHAQGALFGYVHPFDAVPDPAKADEALTDELPVDVALGKVDYYEVVGFSDHLATAKVWYRLLNCGFRIPAAGGTDAMANYASLRGPVGMDRVFVKTEGGLDHARWLAGLKAGRTFATNGPLLQLTLGGKEAGDEIALGSAAQLEAKVDLKSIAPVDHLEIVSNGEVVASFPLPGDRTAASASRPIKVTRSGWYTLRAYSDRSRHPVLDIYPFATTSPIYVTVGGAPVRSKADAEYFLAWISRLDAAARAHTGWNGEEEKIAVLASLDQAKDVYRDRGRPQR
jgi:TolB protein